LTVAYTEIFFSKEKMVTSPENISEPDWLRSLFCQGIKGDSASYGEFLRLISIRVRHLVIKKIPMKDVEDVVQEVLISIHKASHTYNGERPIIPWVFAITQFRINDHLRKIYARSKKEVVVENYDKIETIQDVTIDTSSSELSVDEVLSDVPEKQRKILTMLYMDGYTAKETGNILNMKETTVKVVAHRAIKKVKEKMGL
jgi:RNA polymerase sigma-70 factor, ECF subfamily